jgi:hypothetical protein
LKIKFRSIASVRKCVLVLIGVFLILAPTFFSLPWVVAASAIGSDTVTLYPTADAYVNASSPSTNYGSETSLYVGASSEEDLTYVKFDLASIPQEANVISAKLEIYLSGKSGNIYAVPADRIGAYFCSDNSWQELGITWNNRPSFSSTPTGSWSFGMIDFTGYKSWDVTADVRTALTSGIITEVLKFQSKTGNGQALFRSREGSSTPRLEVEYSTKLVSVVHLESAQYPEATNNLGLITIGSNVFSLPTDIDVVSDIYQIAYSGGYMFMRWETSGGIAVSDANSATTTVTVSGSGTLRAVGNVTQLEYAYDHESISSHSESGRYVDAVRFTPLVSGQLVTARFYMQYISSYSSNTFKVHVMDENRNDIITPFTQTPTFEGWVNVDLTSYGVNVNTGKDFYVGIEWITDYNPSIGEDMYSGFDRSWRWNGTRWEQWTSNDFMIRAVTFTSNPVTYSLTISTTAGGSTDPAPGSHIYNADTSISVQASANLGYAFDHWELGGSNVGSANPFMTTMNLDQALKAIFASLPTPSPSPTPPPTVTTPPPTVTTPPPTVTTPPSTVTTPPPTVTTAPPTVTTAPPTVATPPPTATSPPPTSSGETLAGTYNLIMVAVIALGVAAIAGATIVLIKRKSK